MGYRLNRLDEPVFMAVSKPLLTEFGIHHRLESCDSLSHDVIRLVPSVNPVIDWSKLEPPKAARVW